MGMIFEWSKFKLYSPDITALDILKGIFLNLDREKRYSCNPAKYNKFFQQIAPRYPDLFKDVSIDEDGFLPYSEDIEQAYAKAVEFNMLSRPNPDIYPCQIVASPDRLQKDVAAKFTPEQLKVLKEIAICFEKELQE
jgi:hypothetical protein